MPRAFEGDLDSVVNEALAVQARGRPGLLDQPDRALFEHAGTNPAEHVVLRLLLQDDRFDSGLGQQLPEQQTRGTGADDDDLCSHVDTPPAVELVMPCFSLQINASGE